MMQQNPSTFRDDMIALFTALIPEIQDDYRATDDPDDKEPGMCVTVGTDDDMQSWGYQTGDNSYVGSAYGYSHWAIVYLSRQSNPEDCANEVADQWGELLEC